ncbi:MAG: Wzz/FepE/Etk N-terminal domain-containing protein [Geobacter sp.]
MTTEHQLTPIADDEINLLDLLLVLARRWRMIATTTLFAALASAAVAVLLPNRYQATAKVIALQRQAIQPIGAAFTGEKATVGVQKLPLMPVKQPVLEDILNSDRLMLIVSNQFHFPSLKAFKKQYEVKGAKSGTIEVSAEDADPKRAAAIANAAVAELGRTAYSLNLVVSPEINAEHDLGKIGSTVTTVIKLLEPATPPLEKAKPKRALIVVLVSAATLFASIMLAFMLEALGNLQQDDRKRWDDIKRAFKGR